MIIFFYLFSVYDLNIKIVKKPGWTKKAEETKTNMIKETKKTPLIMKRNLQRYD